MGSLGRYIPFYAVIFMYGLSIALGLNARCSAIVAIAIKSRFARASSEAFSWTGLRYIDQRTPLSDKADEDGSCV